jgi:hypothetical protein
MAKQLREEFVTELSFERATIPFYVMFLVICQRGLAIAQKLRDRDRLRDDSHLPFGFGGNNLAFDNRRRLVAAFVAPCTSHSDDFIVRFIRIDLKFAKRT